MNLEQLHFHLIGSREHEYRHYLLGETKEAEDHAIQTAQFEREIATLEGVITVRNTQYEVISGFRRLDEAETYKDKLIQEQPALKDKANAVMHGDKPVVVVES